MRSLILTLQRKRSASLEKAMPLLVTSRVAPSFFLKLKGSYSWGCSYILQNAHTLTGCRILCGPAADGKIIFMILDMTLRCGIPF